MRCPSASCIMHEVHTPPLLGTAAAPAPVRDAAPCVCAAGHASAAATPPADTAVAPVSDSSASLPVVAAPRSVSTRSAAARAPARESAAAVPSDPSPCSAYTTPPRLNSANHTARTTLISNVSWNHPASSRRRVGPQTFFRSAFAQHVLVECQIGHQTLQPRFSSSSCRIRRTSLHAPGGRTSSSRRRTSPRSSPAAGRHPPPPSLLSVCRRRTPPALRRTSTASSAPSPSCRSRPAEANLL